ncbi:hypothetical protein DFS34DRAFT_63369 [Phlyctochytrium arcticum]|nr:hypothetical protein DFS34DRAFT_63369 [Phlyctochytrium arcticum]
MMLNTDLHRANIGARSSQKITKKQWVSMVLEGMVTQVKQHRDDKSEDKEGMRKWTKTVESMLKRIFDRTAKQALPQREAISLKPAQTSSSPGHPTTVSAPPSLQHQASSQSNMLTSNPSLSNVESDVNNPNSSGEATPTSPASPNMSRLRRDDSSMSISSNVSTGTMFSVSDKRRGTLSSFMLRRKNERPDARAIQFNPEEGTSGVALSLDSQLHLAGGETSRTRAGSASTGGVGGGGSSELLHNDHTHRHAQSASATIGRPSTAGILAARNSTSSWVGHNGGPTLSRRSTPTSSIIGESSAGPSLHPPPLHPQASVASNSSSATGTATTMGLIGEVHLEGQLIRKHLTDKDDTRAKYRKWMKLYTVLALDATHGTLELVMYKLDRATERDHAGFLDAAPPTHSIAQHPPETQAVQEPFVRSGSSGSHEDVGEPHLRRVSTYDQPAPTGMGHASGAWSGPGGERMRVSSDSVLRLVPRLSTQPPQSFNLLHSLATPLPPPGYSPQRPHVFTLRLCDGQIYLFHGMSGENVREWVKTINLWAARKSKEPFPGSGGNVEFGWGPIVADRVQLKQLQAQFSQQKEGKDTSSGNASSPDINKAASDQGSPSVNVSSPVPTSSASASPVPAGHKYAASVRSFASVGSTESGRSAATVPGIMGTTGDAEWSSLTNNQNGALGRRFAGSPAGGGVPSASATIGGSSSSRSAKDLEKRLRKMKIQEWLPPVPLGKVMSVVAEETQLENWRRQQEAIGSDLEEHSSYRDKMDKLYVNHLALKQKAQANWMRKQRWLMREYEKYGTYAQMLQESIVERYAA